MKNLGTQKGINIKHILISFSGGETSAFMTYWLLKINYKAKWNEELKCHVGIDKHENEVHIIIIFANTGQENEETLLFIKKCDDVFGWHCVWVEAVVFMNERKATIHKVVCFEIANRDGQPFQDSISKYGIPNVSTPHCTREMKERPIVSYAKSRGWDDFYTAIGIRVDEIDRMSKDKEVKRFFYPLIEFLPMTKPKINFWWTQQLFRLNLKGYQGNCKTCWKKSDHKLWTIAKETEYVFEFFRKMELQYGQYIPETRLKRMLSRGDTPTLPVRFFRNNRSVQDMINKSKQWVGSIIDDAQIMSNPELFDDYVDLIGGESCEVFSSCNSEYDNLDEE